MNLLTLVRAAFARLVVETPLRVPHPHHVRHLVLVQPAFASANVESLLQNVVDMLTGNTARLLAVLAVVVVGILWMFGLFDLRRAAIVVLGIVVVFGAAEIVNLITGGA